MKISVPPLDTVELEIGGRTYHLRATFGALRRLEARGIPLTQLADIKNVCALLYECLVEKSDVSEDDFAELLPVNFEILAKITSQLFPGSEVPTPAAQVQ
jgi:hypothetical protein